jgi:S-DNA-T family DNA segregation ATPase FtsK/SpoIIIE
VQAIGAIFCVALAIISLLAAFGKAGVAGDYAFKILTKLSGIGYYLIPLVLMLFAYSFLKGAKRELEISRLIGASLFFFSGLGLIHMLPSHSGGYIGKLISTPFISLLDVYAAAALLIAILAISLLVTFDTHITLDDILFWRKFSVLPPTNKTGSTAPLQMQDINSMVGKGSSDSELSNQDGKQSLFASMKQKVFGGSSADTDPDQDPEITPQEGNGPEDDIHDDATVLQNARAVLQQNREEKSGKSKSESLSFTDAEQKAMEQQPKFTISTKTFSPPPLSLLEKDKGKPEVGDIKANANIIKRTLMNFGISVEMDEISIGPSVTRYALKPAEGVKLSKIVGLNNDLALALAAHPIRIEAPIPGKSLVGIEIPNTTKTTVGLASLLASDDYQSSPKPLLVSMGKGITGKSYFADLAKAPHMLVAGATGSGKSVTIHTLITSLLFRNAPENLKFILIDPKRVELTLYNKIPHLLTPVITDPKKAILALKWAGKEMQRRYDILEKNAVRDIGSYHTNVLAPALELARTAKENGEEIDHKTMPETMPYMVIIIDELADIMQTYPRELEAAIVRLAQMSRAVGIHLILSTQRPSVNVITGLIKANVPTRVALQVASQIDSRTILDAAGAEKLLGAGDMLYQGADMAKPVRLQSAYVSENELKKVVQFLHDQYRDEVMAEINLTPQEAGQDAIFNSEFGGDDDMQEEDDMYEDARAVVLETGKASTSFLQRRLGLGYGRAARIVDMLEKRGIIGPANGSKPREVFGRGGDEAHTDEVPNE